MPQLDPSSYPPQLIWLAITFIAMYLLMARVALPRIGQVLEERQARISDNLDMAASLKAEAEAAAEAYEKSLAEARNEGQRVLREVADQMAADAAKRQAELGETLAAEISAAEERIAQARDAALGNIREMAVEVAQEAAGKLADAKITKKAATEAVEAALQERG